MISRRNESLMMKNRPSTTRIRIKTKTKRRRIVIPIRFAVSSTALLIFAILNVNVIGMPLSSPSLLIPSSATASAQTGNQDQQINSSSPTSSSSSDDVFRFTYLKIGISSPNYQRISYDSETNSITINNISAAINKNTD